MMSRTRMHFGTQAVEERTTGKTMTSVSLKTMIIFVLLDVLLRSTGARGETSTATCSSDFEAACSACWDLSSTGSSSSSSSTTTNSDATAPYNCSLPGLEGFTPGIHQGVKANYLSFNTERSSPNLPIRAKEFEACTGGKVTFSEARNVWEDPVKDLGTKTSRGSEVYDGYFMSYSHFPEVSALGLAETLNERIREDNDRLKWEDVLPQVKTMGAYRQDGVTNIDFLMYDGDFFVPVVRPDLLEQYNLPVPNTWEEVVQYAKIFHGEDLNGDGTPDYGFCHFPRIGAGYWDWWFSEAVYSTWASYVQTQGVTQGFFFDEETMEPRIGEGFRRAVQIWKDLWSHGNPSFPFIDGRCAIGYGPPGEWKALFLHPDGIHRKDANGTVVWRATLQNGNYAEPYRFKPFGSLDVEDPSTGLMVPCTPELCPKGEAIPSHGHHGEELERLTKILPPSPLEGMLINRAPFYWSGGLGTLIRKSSPKVKKDLLWDFFVYTNSPDTAVHDVASYNSWLDSWRYSQLFPGDNFAQAGWSFQSYQEHANIMQWALSETVNGALNIRIPGAIRYTRDVMGEEMRKFIEGTISLDDLVDSVTSGWHKVTNEEGLLDQLDVYRSSLGLDLLSEVDLCRLHRVLMDDVDPSVCRQYDPIESKHTVVVAILVPLIVCMVVLIFFIWDQRRRSHDLVWQIEKKELQFADPPQVAGRGTFGMVVLAHYRGTQVAVKRVIPPRASDATVTSMDDPTRFEEVEIDLEALRQKMQSGDHSYNEEKPEKAVLTRSTSSGLGSYFNRNKDGLAPCPGLEINSNSIDLGIFIYNGSDGISTSPVRMTKQPTRATHAKLKADFLVEIKELSKLRHPCITTIMGAVTTKGEEPLLVMEFMDHGSLYDMLHNDTMVFDGEILLPILRDIAQGLRFLHSATPQIVHSDLKASNILVDSRFRAKVADFGLSQKRKVGAVGTPFWLAPEVLRGDTSNTPESDVYAFGMIIWEIYSRKDPFDTEDFREVLRDIAFHGKRPSTPLACPPKAQSMLEECMYEGAMQRPTFEELDLQLKRLDPTTMAPLGQDTNLPNSLREKDRIATEGLLFEVFPRPVAEALRDGRKVEPQSREIATVFFSDIIGFTEISSTLTPIKVSELLGRLYSRFDDLARKHEVYKVETVGDAYMVCTNVVQDQPDHVKRIALFSIDAIQAAQETLVDVDDESMGYVNIRVGFHSGPVVANVVGSLNPRYCLFGDVVNTSSRMESTSKRNRIQCSERSACLLRDQCPSIKVSSRGLIEIKGKGSMYTFWVGEYKEV